MVKVSVVVPVFDPGEYIEPLLDSLHGQSLPAGEWEAVFVDDGSSDGKPERLAARAPRPPPPRFPAAPPPPRPPRAPPFRGDPPLWLAGAPAQHRHRPSPRRVRVLRRPGRLAGPGGARAAVRDGRGRRRRHRDRQGGRPRQGRPTGRIPP